MVPNSSSDHGGRRIERTSIARAPGGGHTCGRGGSESHACARAHSRRRNGRHRYGHYRLLRRPRATINHAQPCRPSNGCRMDPIRRQAGRASPRDAFSHSPLSGEFRSRQSGIACVDLERDESARRQEGGGIGRGIATPRRGSRASDRGHESIRTRRNGRDRSARLRWVHVARFQPITPSSSLASTWHARASPVNLVDFVSFSSKRPSRPGWRQRTSSIFGSARRI